MNEQGGSLKIGEVRRSQLSRLAGWMQWIRHQQERIHKLRSFGREDARLSAAIRVTANPDSLWLLFADLENLFAKAFAVVHRIAGPRRSMRPLQAKRKIDAKHFNIRLAEPFSDRH